MGARGPVPKRASTRAGHRTKAEQPDTIKLSGLVSAPRALAGWHVAAARWYRSLAQSGQSLYYEPSDWEYARLTAQMLSDELGRPVPSAPGRAIVLSMMARLGTTEGDRRRMRIEIEHPNARRRDGSRPDAESGELPKNVAVLEQARRLADK